MKAVRPRVLLTLNFLSMTGGLHMEAGRPSALRATGAGIAAPGNEKQTFSHVFSNRAHTCLQAIIQNADENDDETNDRAQINWEVVHADLDYIMWIPFGNGAGEEIIVNGTTMTCIKNNTEVECLPEVEGRPNPNNPWLAGAPGQAGQDHPLAAGEEYVAMLLMPEIPEGGMLLKVEAVMNGQLNNVMIQVVKTSIAELLNAAHLCCIKSVRTRVLLESILVEALEAYEASNCKLGIKKLRMFVQKAILLECDLSDPEIMCIEKAILKIVDAGILIARDLGSNVAYLEQAHFFRRAGLYEAALFEAAKAC